MFKRRLKEARVLLGALMIGAMFGTTSHAVVVDFEDTGLGAGAFDNGDPGGLVPGDTYSDTHTSRGATLNVEGGQDATFDYFFWSGWAISNLVDNTTAGFGNQYSAFPGSGSAGSATYAVAFVGGSAMPTIQLPVGQKAVSIDVTNTTYAALSMLNGDAFAFPFGGPSGDEPDQFTLTITGNNGAGSINILLADYTSADPNLDVIVEDWMTVDISGLSAATELTFGLTTTALSPTGPVTPLYFAVDNLVVRSDISVPEPASVVLLFIGFVTMIGRPRRLLVR